MNLDSQLIIGIDPVQFTRSAQAFRNQINLFFFQQDQVELINDFPHVWALLIGGNVDMDHEAGCALLRELHQLYHRHFSPPIRTWLGEMKCAITNQLFLEKRVTSTLFEHDLVGA